MKPFVIYDLRHTCLTRWARYLDPFTLKDLAGHESLETTMKYIHLNEQETAERLQEVRERLDTNALGNAGYMKAILQADLRANLPEILKRLQDEPGNGWAQQTGTSIRR